LREADFHVLFSEICFPASKCLGRMHLKTLTLKGFKSFADTTTLDLEPGVTVVVGPNGSGKSNIVDAVAWVLGAQGAKSMRTNKMEDVIFAGTSKKAALGRAEVSLTIDNSDGALPIEYAEVKITRTLFRSGESEYAINGVSCRLLDVQELLSDTGVGRQQHVIVSQGQLAAILDSRPEDRRSVIEEAAGVLKYRKRRERAQRRLESTEANFVRLGDLLREIRRQLRPLERQADSARKYESMTTELRQLRLHISGRELAGLRVRAETSARGKAEGRRREDELRTQLAGLDADVMLAESQLSAVGGGAAVGEAADDPFLGVDLGDVLARTESLYAKARGHLAFLGERRRSIERDRNAFVDQGVVESLSAEAARLDQELAEVQTQAMDLPAQFEELGESEAALGAEREEFLEAWGADTAAEGEGASVTSAQVRSEMSSARQSMDRARADVARIDARVVSLNERVARLAADIERFDREILSLIELVGEGGAAEALVKATAERTRTEEAQVVAESAVQASEDALREADGEAKSWAARVSALSAALDEARARAGAQRLAGLEGIIGTLLDLVEVDAGFEAPFEAALGEAVSAVVVRDAVVARAALTRLHEQKKPGAVLALDALRALTSSGASSSASVSAIVGAEPLRAHVRATDASVTAILDVLLGAAVVVEGDWTSALDVALANPNAVVVTFAGDRFAGSGWRAGAGSAGATGAALEEAQLRAGEAKSVSESARAALMAAREAQNEARTVVKAARAAEQSVATEHNQRVNRLGNLRNNAPRLVSDRSEAVNELSGLEGQRAELIGRIEADDTRIGFLDSQLPALVEAENEMALRQAKRREASQRLDQKAGAVGSLRRELEVRAAGIEERRRILVGRLETIEERLSRSVAEREVAEQRRVELDFLVLQTEELHAFVEDRAALLEEGLVDLRERRRRQNEQARSATAKLDGLRRARSEAEKALTQTLERIQRSEIDDAEIRLRLETLVEQIRREFDLEPDKAVEAECPVMVDGTAPTTRVRDLERELRLLGPINPLALEEFTALAERSRLIEGELEDVKTARRDLAKVIKAIDEEIVTTFTSAFADVSDNFTRLFETLFPGGQGRLRLTDPDNILETGIEVEARPSGKNVRKLSLLSGGERSLTAMAFLFAVFRSRPSPFYLMDEVEAALDDVNLHRFIGLLDEFRQEAQLLVVSHQKRTMEAADCLYGVTMVPGGSSRVVSERIARTLVS
jgi:chromosome segregation protein